jgi:hypothetical protein
MAQQQKVRAPIPVSDEPPVQVPERSSANPWLVGALVGLTLAFAALVGWNVYERVQRADAAALATAAAAAWDSPRTGSFADVYDRNAVVVDADGQTLTGVDEIETAARRRGADFTMAPLGEIAVSRDGTFATMSYRYAADGRGVGLTVIQVDNGKIVHQWIFEPSSDRALSAAA